MLDNVLNNDNDANGVYRIVQNDDEYRVQTGDGYVVVTCRDPHSAQHYASLLDQAYRVGYKAGYRARKKV